MFSKKSIITLILAGAIAITATACGNSGATDEKPAAPDETPTATEDQASEDKVGETVLKVSFNQSIDNPEAKTAIDMSNKLFDATEGRYSLEVYPNEQLGSQQQSLELVQAGAIDMAIVANSIVENVNPDFSVIGCPYIYDSVEHQRKLFESGKLNDLYATTESSGFTVLASYSLGPRCIYGKEAMTTPEELAGKKIRVMQSETMVKMLGYMGGIGTPMGQGDVYSAIQAGTLDGAENNIITYTDLLQYEVAPYFTETNHLMIPDELIINTNVLQGMSEADQAALKEVATASVDVMFTLSEELREEYYTKCRDELGVTITEVDIKPFQDNMSPLIESVTNRSDMTKAIYEEILALR